MNAHARRITRTPAIGSAHFSAPCIRWCGAAALAALLAATPAAAADPFALTGQSRTAEARLLAIPVDADRTAASVEAGAWEAGWELGPFTMNGFPDGTATASLAIVHQSFIGTSRLSFSASADAFATGFRTSEFGDYMAIADALTTYDVAFDIVTLTAVQLTMESEILREGLLPLSVFDFELLRDGTVVWTDELKRDPRTGAETRSFTQTLLLQPGHYDLSGLVWVDASVTPDLFLERAHVVAAFTLAAVPAPHTWASMLAGIALIGALLRRARRTSEKEQPA